MVTGLPTLIIGVGGTGLRVLQRVKERLIETYYGDVPPQITLLEFDTALQSPADNFVGVQLTQNVAMYGSSAVQQEMQLIQTNPSFTMDHAMAEARQGERRWDWMEVVKLDRLLPPQARSILDGAGAFRPVGRTAFFLNYGDVAQKLRLAMQQVMKATVDVGSGNDVTDVAKAKRNVFLVSSLAGGTGSGGFIDLAALMRNIKQFDSSFSDIVLIGIIVLPRFFANIQDELGRRVPNTYAGLRELDRFMRAHKSGTPYRYTGGHAEEVTINNQLFDLCYLVDVEDYAGRPAGVKPELGGLPAIADMIVAHTDLRLGLRLNAANINVASNYALPRVTTTQPFGLGQAAQQYTYQSKRYYSSLNCHTVIFPREDVAKSLSLRFLIDFIDSYMIARDQRGQLVVPADPLAVNELVEFLAKPNPTTQERMAAQGDSEGKESYFNLGICVQTMLQNTDRRFDTEPESVMKWLVEEPERRKAALEVIRRSIEETTKDPSDPNNMNSYVSKVRNWLDKYLGTLVDPNNIYGDREDGAWEKELGNLVTEQRQAMESYVQTMVMRMLNQRQEVTVGDGKTSLMRANRLSYVLATLRQLKDRVRAFIKQADMSFGETSKNVLQLRRDLEEQRGKVAAFKGPIVPMFNPNPGPAYLKKLREVAEAERQRMLRNLAVDMASQFGGDIASAGRTQSVLDTAIQEIESWVKGLDKVRELIAQERGRHEARRKEKYAIGVRSYITDSQKFPKAAEVEEELYQRYKTIVVRTLLGPDPLGEGGAFLWEVRGSSYFDYQITTKQKYFKLHPNRKEELFGLFGTASGVEEISHEWQAGGFRLMAEQIRNDKLARVAAYLPRFFADQGALLNSVVIPNSKALVKLQGIQPNDRQRELYLAIDPTSDDMKVNDYYSWFGQKWKSTDQNQDFLQSESDLSCTLLTLYHGLEIDHFNDFNASEGSYRAMERQQGCLHLFPEERLAADYEAQIPTLRRNDWGDAKRLHPEVVIGLHDSKHVRSFAQALVCGLIEDINDGASREIYLCLNGARQLLTSSHVIDNLNQMGPNDQIAARILQAFHTYNLIGKPINDQYGFDKIDYDAVTATFQTWFNGQYKDKTGAEIEQLLKQWETDPNGQIAPLFHSEGKDPRFRDLGIVLILELTRWRQLFR